MKTASHFVVLLAVLIAVTLLVDAWRTARHDSQQLAETVAAQNTVIQQAGAHEKERDSELASALATMRAQKRAVQTPQQAAKRLTSVLPLLPLPVSILGPDLSVPLSPDEAPSTSISIPQPDLVPLYDALQDCRASASQNDALKKDLADEKLRSAALGHERDAAAAVARGGTILLRIKQAAKWFAIGIATGAAVAAIARH